MWQLRFDGTVAGIDGPVDIDVARLETLREHAAIPEGRGRAHVSGRGEVRAA